MFLWLQIDPDTRMRLKCPLDPRATRKKDSKQVFDSIRGYYDGYFRRLDMLREALLGDVCDENRLEELYKFDLEALGDFNYLLTLKRRRGPKSWKTVDVVSPVLVRFLNS